MRFANLNVASYWATALGARCLLIAGFRKISYFSFPLSAFTFELSHLLWVRIFNLLSPISCSRRMVCGPWSVVCISGYPIFHLPSPAPVVRGL